MFDFNKCHPIELDDLVRVGNDFDGGYILSKRMIEKTKIVLSFGVNDDWTFEEDFASIKDVKIYSYDYSTKNLPFMSGNFEINYVLMVYNFFRLKRSRVLHQIRYIREQVHLLKSFKMFFDEKKDHFFVPKFIERYDDEQTTCFKTIFKELGAVDDLSIFLKMDIDGVEYLCLYDLIPYLDKINGMVIEFHNLEIADMKCEELLNEFSKKFYVAHTHGNNNRKLIYRTNIPTILEMSFINKKIAPEKIKLSDKKYPIKGLDAPCCKNIEDYELKFRRN
ncbi:MAG: hypothetical protein LBC77_02760 [Spirochaetaceae bacterium]|jgi:hypothetical protein|nr:hypothetical protein [Spirochaetaceae bacterium]